MKKEILFLTDDSQHDAVAYCVLCYVAQTTKTPLTVVFPERGYHDKIADVFKLDTTVYFTASISTAINYLDSYEIEQCDKEFASLHHLCRQFDVPEPIEYAAVELDSESRYYLPSVLGEMLHRRMGLIDFGNFIAARWIENDKWDICRDVDVLDILHPPEVDHVSLS